MATIPQIAMGFRQPEIASPLNMMAQVSQIQAAQDANALRQFQMQQALRQQEQENALAALPYGTLAATPQEALRYGAPGRQLYESLLKGSKEKREAELAEARIAGENIKTAKASLGGVSDQSTFDAWRENTVRLLPGLAGALPTTYSPEAVRKLALDADKLYENVTSTINLGRIQTVVQTPKYGGGLARPVGSFAEMPTELDVARTEQAQAAAGASRAQAQRDRVPMSVQEFEAFNRMTPEQQAAFTAFRASQRPTTTVTTNVLSGEKLTPLQEAIDRKFADDLIAWKSGASVSAAKNAAQIATVLDQLHEGKQLTGPMVGITPDVVLAVTNPNALDARQRVEQVAQESLRSILGAQFTQKEGEAFIARVYDPKLKPEKNASRLRALFKQIDEAAKQKQAMVDYADTHGTLRGFKGTVPTMADFYAAIGEKPEDAAKSARPRGSAPVRSAEGTTSTSKFRLIGPAPAEQ